MKVRWEGPEGAVNRDLGAEVGDDRCHIGKDVAVSDGLGVQLCLSSADWKPAGKRDADLVARARAERELLGSDLAEAEREDAAGETAPLDAVLAEIAAEEGSA